MSSLARNNTNIFGCFLCSSKIMWSDVCFFLLSDYLGWYPQSERVRPSSPRNFEEMSEHRVVVPYGRLSWSETSLKLKFELMMSWLHFVLFKNVYLSDIKALIQVLLNYTILLPPACLHKTHLLKQKRKEKGKRSKENWKRIKEKR